MHANWPSPDFVFYADEAYGASTILFVGEAKLSRTDPSEASDVVGWSKALATQLAPLGLPATGHSSSRDPLDELRKLLDSTRLPVEEAAVLIGASRRSVYNWLAGRPIRDEAQARIFRFQAALAPIVQSRDPALVRDWLLRGSPEPAKLAADQRWEELDSRVSREVAPIRPTETDRSDADGRSHAETADVLRAALVAFATAPSSIPGQRPGWHPRELTGIASEYEEDE
jgi:hypothetical protein